MPNIRKKDYNKLEEYEKLLLVFNENDNNILNELSKGDKIMKEYIDDSRRASEEDEVIGMYDKELHEERVSIAKQMIQENIDLNIVSKCTGLSFEELQKLK